MQNRLRGARLAPFADIRLENPWEFARCGGIAVTRLLGFLGTLVGGSLGWWLGDFVGLFTAVFLSAIGSGVGLYYGRRLADWMVE